jgi:hypothetical protein
MSNEQPHDPTITLRLELGRVTDQRDAYQSALRKEVLAVIRDAIAETSRLQAEVARLSAEVEELQRLLTAATFYKEGKQS